MLNAKKNFSKIATPADLQKLLLTGSSFYEIDHIEEDGLNEFFNLLGNYRSDDSYVFSRKKARKKTAVVNPESTLSDEEFVEMASHLLIQKELEDKTDIYYRNLASNVSPDILKEYMNAILDSIRVNNGRITSITFKNGLTHKFEYKTDENRKRRYF